MNDAVPVVQLCDEYSYGYDGPLLGGGRQNEN